jgi:hypothetical protein
MKLHVSARSGHHQVSHRLRGFVAIRWGCWSRDLYLSSPIYCTDYRTISVGRRHSITWGGRKCAYGLHSCWRPGLVIALLSPSGLCGLGGCFLQGRESVCVKQWYVTIVVCRGGYASWWKSTYEGGTYMCVVWCYVSLWRPLVSCGYFWPCPMMSLYACGVTTCAPMWSKASCWVYYIIITACLCHGGGYC